MSMKDEEKEKAVFQTIIVYPLTRDKCTPQHYKRYKLLNAVRRPYYCTNSFVRTLDYYKWKYQRVFAQYHYTNLHFYKYFKHIFEFDKDVSDKGEKRVDHKRSRNKKLTTKHAI